MFDKEKIIDFEKLMRECGSGCIVKVNDDDDDGDDNNREVINGENTAQEYDAGENKDKAEIIKDGGSGGGNGEDGKNDGGGDDNDDGCNDGGEDNDDGNDNEEIVEDDIEDLLHWQHCFLLKEYLKLVVLSVINSKVIFFLNKIYKDISLVILQLIQYLSTLMAVN